MDDEELRARLRSADPARGDRPADSWIDELVEATMAKTQTQTQTQETGQAHRRWVLPAAAAAVLAAVAGGVFALTAGDDGNGGEAQPTQITLGLPKRDPMAMCAVLTPETLGAADQAFSGTVQDVGEHEVTLATDHWYKGGDADLVTLRTLEDDWALLEGGIAFEEGKRYLVSASDDTVGICGASGEWSSELAAIYDQAF